MNAYRRAALVVASLERNAADDLLDRLPNEQARAIRDEMVLLDELKPDEQEDAIGEYLQSPSNVPSDSGFQGNDRELATPCSETNGPDALSSMLRELLTQEDGSIADAIKHERSSIVAALLHILPQKRAAGVLRLLPSSLQWRVLTNLNHDRMAKAEIVDVIADRICDKLPGQLPQNRSQTQSDALQAIFNELNRDEQRDMLRSLSKENPMLAQRLVPADSVSHDCYC